MKTLSGALKAVVVAALLLGGSLFAKSYNLDKAHTSVGFSVKHLMITNVRGEFMKFDAMVDFDPANMVFVGFDSSIDVKTIDTGIVKRDDHLRSQDFFHAEKFPEMKFKMTGYEPYGADGGKMMGDLTIRGVTKPVVFEAEIHGVIDDPWGNERVGFTLDGRINRTDWGLNWNDTLETGGVLVGEKVRITVEAQVLRKK